MASYPLPRAPGSGTIVLDGAVWNRLCDIVERCDRLKAVPPLIVNDRGAFKVIDISLPSTAYAGDFWVSISTATQNSGVKQWVYTGTEVVKSLAGYGSVGDRWTIASLDRASGLSIYNSIENMNGGSGLYGNGVNSGRLTGSFDIQPIPVNDIVRVTPLVFSDGEGGTITELWCQYENGVDGACASGS